MVSSARSPSRASGALAWRSRSAAGPSGWRPLPSSRATTTRIRTSSSRDRGISGGASQIFVTAPAATRKIQAFDIACVGSRLLAIAWLEHTGDTSRARLLLTDFDAVTPTALGGASLSGVVVPSATNSLHNLGPAGPKDGIAVAAIGDRVLVSWSSGEKRSLQIKRFDIGSGSDSTDPPTADRADRQSRRGPPEARRARQEGRARLLRRRQAEGAHEPGLGQLVQHGHDAC